MVLTPSRKAKWRQGTILPRKSNNAAIFRRRGAFGVNDCGIRMVLRIARSVICCKTSE